MAAPTPGNAWPRDMVITIEESPFALLELLWIREAWELETEQVDPPPKLARTPRPVSGEGTQVSRNWNWGSAWPEVWEVCVAGGGVLDRAALERLAEPDMTPVERAELLGRVHEPSWRHVFGDAAFTPGFYTWATAENAVIAAQRTELADQPESLALDALIPAWEAGLEHLVVIPCRGTFTRRLTTSTLLVTAETRNDPGRYGEALVNLLGREEQ